MRFLAVLALGLVSLSISAPSYAAPPACDAGAEGTIIYNKDQKLVQFCNGTQWIGMVAKIGGTGDTLGDLACDEDEVPVWNGAAWDCGEGGGGGLWTDSGSGYLTYTGTDVGVKLQSITGMAPPTNTLADLGCTNNQILKWDGDSWECAADAAGSGGVTALTGDVTASGTGSVAATIANNAVTNTKIANTTIVATDKLSATGTKNSTTFLRGDNTWAAPPSGGISTTTRLSCTGSCTVTCTAGWLRTGCGAAATNYLCYPNTANGCQGNGSGTCYAVCAQ